MCRVNSWFKKYNTLFLSATVIHRTWLDKMNSKDYHFAKELRSTLSSYSKYERVKCNTDKLPNITALNMTVTRLPANLASRTHNFSLTGIMCPWLSPITVSISSNQKSDFAEHTFFEEKKIQLSLAYIYLSLRRRLMRRYWISVAQSECRRENRTILPDGNRLPRLLTRKKLLCPHLLPLCAFEPLWKRDSYLYLTRIRVLTLWEIPPRKINLSSHLLTLHKRFA